jgi:hypothetical protein
MPDDYNYGIAVTVSNLASAEIAKINKQLDGLGKQVVQNAKITKQAAKQEAKATRAYGDRLKEQLTAKGYLNNLLKRDQATFKRTNNLISQQGALTRLNTEIRKKGYSAISKANRQALTDITKDIKLRQKSGMITSGWARSNEEAILRLDQTFKKHGGNIRNSITGIGTSFSKLGAGIHKIGMGFLTLIGPLFLVGAAMRVVQQATDAVMQPFLGFEDGLYELRKTADLTKEEMLLMGDAIELMAQRIPIARKELVEIAATAGRLGIQGRQNILNFTEVVAMMATATVLSADEAANALARVSNAFQLPIANVEYLGSIINELSNTTASNSREIVKSIENVGASGKMMGISIDAVAAMSATLIAAGMSSERSGCLDDETEVLTKDGWKGIDEISEDDSIATRTPKGYLEYRKPKLIFRRKWNGDMVHLKTSRADILVTPDHRMLITTPYINYEKKVEAKSLLTTGSFKIPRTCKWKGLDEKIYTMSSTNYLKKNGEIKSILDERRVDMLEWCKFMGYFLSEGSVTRRGNDHGSVELSQLDGPTKEKMWENVESLGFIPHNHKNQGISIYNKQLYKTLEEYVGVKAPFKYVPQYIKDLDIQYLHTFLNAFIDGDGSRSMDGTQKIFTASKRLLDDLWEISLKCGYHVSDGSRYGGYNNSKTFILYLGKKKYATFINRRGNVKSEHYEGRIWCPVLPPYETILIKRNGKVAWTFQTRLRRFFTEMARNSSKMAKEMDIDAATMKISIEEDPTKAIMDYLKHLREVPNRIDKIVEAQEIFGKVGGFAVATLAENYVDLGRNMSAARTELAFGTSLQREFKIAISKTSAQLQMLDNRTEAAAASIGEDFVPAIKGGKSVLAGMAEALADVSHGFWSVGENADSAASKIDAYVDEMARLRTEADEGVSSWDKLGTTIRLGTASVKAYVDPSKYVTMNRAILGLATGIDNLEKKTRDLNNLYAIQDQLSNSANVAYGTQVKSIKELTDFKGKYGVVLKNIEDLNIKIRDSERGIAAAEKNGLDVSEERNQLMVDEEILRLRGMQTVRDALREKIEFGKATKKEREAYAELSGYLDGYVDDYGNITKVLSKTNAIERLNVKTLEWKNKLLTKESDFYIHLNAVVGEHADQIMNSIEPQKALNKEGYEAVLIEDRLAIVSVELAKDLYALEEPTLRIAAAFEEFGKKPKESMKDIIARMTEARKESSMLYYDIINQASAWNELGSIMVSDNKTMRESIANFSDMEKGGKRVVITHKGIEAITTEEAAKMKKLGSQIIYVTDTMEDMNNLGKDTITIWGDLSITQSEYEKRLNSIWGLTSSYIGTLRKLGDAQDEFNDASKEMPTRIKELWRPYQHAFTEVERLVAKNEDYEAGIKLQAIAQDIAADRGKARSRRERDDLGRMLDYLDDYTKKTGLIPAEYTAIENEVALLKDMMFEISEGEIVISADLNKTPFDDQMQRLIDADYVTSVKVEMNLGEVEKQLTEAAAAIPVPLEKAVQKVKEEPERILATPYLAPERIHPTAYVAPESQVPIPFDPTRGVPEHIGKHYEVAGDPIVELQKENTEENANIVDAIIAIPGKIADSIMGFFGGGFESGGAIPSTGLYQLHSGEHVLNKGETSHVRNVHAALGISDIVPSMQTGGRIDKTGLYNLHEGEHVLTKEQTKTIDSHNIDVHMGGVTLSENYNVQRLLRDIDEMGMSAI